MESVLIYTVQSGPIWDWRVVVDLFCGGVGVGASLLAVALSRSEDVQRLKLAQTAAFTGPVMVIVGLLFLFTKLGNQLNVHQMPVIASALSLGPVLQGALVLCGLIYAWQWRDINARSGRNTMGCLVGVLAVTVGIYHGVLLGALTARPLWANGSMLFLSVSIFLSTGIAGALLIHYIRMGASGDGAAMRPVFVALAVSLMVTMIALANSWAGLNYGSLASQQALAAASDTYGTMLCGVGVGMGLILPLILLMPVLRRRDEYGGLSLPVIALACLLVLVGGFATRYVVVLGGQLPPPIATLS